LGRSRELPREARAQSLDALSHDLMIVGDQYAQHIDLPCACRISPDALRPYPENSEFDRLTVFSRDQDTEIVVVCGCSEGPKAPDGISGLGRGHAHRRGWKLTLQRYAPVVT